MRRGLVAALAAGLVTAATTAPAAAAPKPVTGNSAAFADSVGVNIHEFYPSTAYGDKARLKSLLLDLGVKHVRDGMRLNREPYQTEYPSARDLAANGIKFLWGTGDPGELTPSQAMALLTDPNRLGGTAEAFEGPNEYDKFRKPNPTTGRDPVWAASLLGHMTDWYTAFKNDSRFGSMPFWGPSFLSRGGRDEYGSTPGSHQMMDAPNAHPYPGGRTPESTIPGELDANASAFGNRRPVVTETGYHTAVNNGNWGHFGVSERAQSIYIARTLLTTFAAGAPRTYLYQFLDQKPEPALKDMEEHFGLVAVEGTGTSPFAWTLRRKPAFDTLKEILEITRDTGTGARPTSLDYSLSGAPAGLKQVLLARSGGVVDLVLWNPASVYKESVWDCNDPRIPATITDPHQRCEYAKYHLAVDQGDLFPADVPVTLNLAEPAEVSTERPHSQRDFTSLGRGTSFTFDVGADPIFVRVKLSKYATEVRADRPSAWLRFAESSGKPVDSAGLGATTDPWVAAPTYGGTSAVGDPEDRSVTVGPDQRTTVQLPAPASTGSGASIELWVKPSASAPDWAHFLTTNQGDWTASMRTYNTLGGDRRGSAYGSAFGHEMVFGGFAADAWHHVVLTMANGTSTTYLDGQKVGERTGGQTLDLSRFTIGARAGTGGFAGSLDELAVYPSALSAGRVCAHYRAAGGSC